MSIAIWFWIIYVLGFLFGAFGAWQGGNWKAQVPALIWWVLIGLLGWAVFGAPIQ